MELTMNESMVINANAKKGNIIEKAFSNYGTRYYKQSIKEVLERKNVTSELERIKKDSTIEVLVTDHALERWNERVGGEYFHTKYKLAKFLSTLLSTTAKRFEVLEEPTKDFNTYLIEIDKDILASVSIEGKLMRFHSFFGRQSIKPALRNWWTLRSYLRKQAIVTKKRGSLDILLGELNPTARKENTQCDKVDLTVSLEELNKQKLPAIPITNWTLKTKQHMYVIEKYYVTDQKEPVYLIFQQHCDFNIQYKLKSFFVNPKDTNDFSGIPSLALKMIGKDEPKLFNLKASYEKEFVTV